jgi:hypothetical protein
MMLTSRSNHIAAIGLCLSVALAAGAYAAGPPALPQGAASVEAARQQLRAARDAARNAERMARLEGRIAFARTRLAITPAQAGVWDAFAAALRAQEAARAQARLAPQAARPLPPTLPERLQLRRTALAAEVQRLDAVSRALTPLYNALSVEQKLVAERLLRGEDGRIELRDRR